MHWGLTGAFLAALAYGVATILQAIAVSRTERSEELDPRLLLRLARSTPYVLGSLLDAVGFLLSLVALRSEPLFLVQAIVAASLAVTALLAAIVLRVRLRPPERIALCGVLAGLVLLGVAAGSERTGRVELIGRAGLLAAMATLAVIAVVAARARPGDRPTSGWALGVLAGLGFAGASIGARVLYHPRSITGLLGDPATYALIAGGLLGMLLYAQALQRGSVTVITAAVVATETLVPSAVGLVLLSDHPRHKFAVVSALGFGLTVLGALALARLGEPRRPPSAAG